MEKSDDKIRHPDQAITRVNAKRLALLLWHTKGVRHMRLVNLASALQRNIFDQMEGTYPNEGGGFLLGNIQDGGVTIEDIILVENVFAIEEQHHRYAMRPQDWMRLEDEAEARGLNLIGYYHSHPDSPAIPSEFDREHALPNFVYVITSVIMGRAGGHACLDTTRRSQRLRPIVASGQVVLFGRFARPRRWPADDWRGAAIELA